MLLQRIAFDLSAIKPPRRFNSWSVDDFYLDFLGRVDVGQAGYIKYMAKQSISMSILILKHMNSWAVCTRRNCSS